MTVADLPQVRAIAEQVHPNHPEDPAIFAERLTLYPAGCLVLPDGSGLAGYALAHPWLPGQPPALNSLLHRLPAMPGTFYLHDLALLPAARGGGVGRAALALLAAQARREGLPGLSLVAVGNSAGFWQRHGFRPVPDPALAAKLASYGPGARFMTLLFDG
jgi:GNAT superfamily N-acetyltransferase